MKAISQYLLKANLKNPKWWFILFYVLIATCVLVPFAVVAYVLDTCNDAFDLVLDKLLKKLKGQRLKLEAWVEDK